MIDPSNFILSKNAQVDIGHTISDLGAARAVHSAQISPFLGGIFVMQTEVKEENSAKR